VFHLHGEAIPNVTHRSSTILASSNITFVRRESNGNDIICVLNEMALGICGWVINDTHSSCLISNSTILKNSEVVLCVATSETMNPFKLCIDNRSFILVLWSLCEALRFSHLANPWLYSHKLVTSSKINLSELVIVKVITATFNLFNLGCNLLLLFLLTLSFGSLTSFFGSRDVVLSDAIISIGVYFHFLLFISIIILNLSSGTGTTSIEGLVIIIKVCIPDKYCLITTACCNYKGVICGEFYACNVTTMSIMVSGTSLLFNTWIFE